jgi:Protein of unknown function (DUF2637)
MSPMGRHSPPLDGTVTANGRALAPFNIQPLRTLGPVPALLRQGDKPAPRRAVSARVIESCYILMAAVTIIATGVGFWLSYAGLHSFAVLAGLSGPEAWAWPASVDLFILAGELGITISTLRDGRPDWRAWGYFFAGCGPSVTFNVLHVTDHFPAWGKYAVAATPPVAAVLALAALMQQVISLPAALRHLHARQDMTDDDRARPGQPGKNGGEGTGLAGSRARQSPPSPRPLSPPRHDSGGDKPPRRPAPREAAPALAKAPSVADVIRDNPGRTNAELAALAGCKVRTIQRHKPKTP